MYRAESGPSQEQFRGRLRFLWVLVLVGLFILLLRVGWLQLGQGERYLHLARTHSLRLIPLPAPRGLILDRRGRVLADNQASFSLAVVPANIRDEARLLADLAEAAQIDPTAGHQRIVEAHNPFRPVVLRRNLEMELVTYLLERERDFPGMLILDQPVRRYPHEKLGAHVLGYVGEASPQEVRSEPGGVDPGDTVGKLGVERYCDTFLRGQKGARQVEVDALGRQVRTIQEQAPRVGNRVYLTLDLAIQQVAEEEFGERKGAVVMQDVHSGAILALVSRPGFNPEVFARGISEAEWEELRSDSTHPLENRVLRGEYPPASTFKLVVTTAALEENLAVPTTTYVCAGVYPVGNRQFRCWKEEGHGRIALPEAVVHSCNIYFYQLGLDVGVELLVDYAHRLGLGSPTGLRLGPERPGLVPTRSWKGDTVGEAWYPGDTANLSIGQGYALVTPLQLLRLISAIANGGYLVQPRVVDRVVSESGRLVHTFLPEEQRRVDVTSKALAFLRDTLPKVVTEGTGWRAQNEVVTLAGKTGTPQGIGEEADHNWFVGYAPADDPEVALVVLVEHRQEEVSIAPQIAGKIMARVFEQNLLHASGTP